MDLISKVCPLESLSVISGEGRRPPTFSWPPQRVCTVLPAVSLPKNGNYSLTLSLSLSQLFRSFLDNLNLHAMYPPMMGWKTTCWNNNIFLLVTESAVLLSVSPQYAAINPGWDSVQLALPSSVDGMGYLFHNDPPRFSSTSLSLGQFHLLIKSMSSPLSTLTLSTSFQWKGCLQLHACIRRCTDLSHKHTYT